MAVQIQIRRGTASEWTSANPTLADGELGLETDTTRIKIGDGATAWNSLGYQVGDITGVTAGTGLSGGGTSGSVTLSIDSTVATLTGAQTLTNKTISGSDNTLSSIPQSAVTSLTTDLSAKAPLASPDLTGTPTAPTAASGTNTTQIATTSFVQSALTTLINGAPAALDTLNELAAALGNDSSFATTVTNSLALKAPLASPSLTGTPLAPTAAADTNSTQIATTAFVIGQGYLKSITASSTYAPLNSPTFTGTPAAPTAAPGTDTTQVATTAFVKAEIAATPASEPIHPFVTGVL